MIKKFKSFLVSLGIVSISTFPVYACGEHEYEHEISKAKAISQSEMGNVVIFIDFNDTNSFTGDRTKSSQVNTTYNEFSDTNNDGKSDNANISLKSYIYDLTRGKTSVNSYLYPQDNNGNYTSYKAPNSKSYYQTQSMTSKAEIDLIKNAFNSVSSQINLTDKQLDGDGDGNIDNVTFVFSGIPDNGNSMLRPHKYHITSGNPTVNGKKLYNYNIVAEGSLNINIYNGKQLGTITHEFLHTLGYPDLYVGTNFSSKPVEDWDIMAKTSGTPRLPLVYSRNTYGNNNLKVQEITTSGTYTLKYSDSPNSQDVVAFKIPSTKYPNEYFMIEYRKNDTKYDKSLPGSGLIVYRINNNIDPSKGNYTVDGHHIYVYRPNETSENAGQGDIANAYLSSESGRTTFGTKKGASFTFDPNSIYFSNGVNSGIVISEVGSTNSDEITFKIEIPDESSTIQGDGSINNPFVIDEPSDMELLHYNLDKHFVLANDIDLKGIDFKPIGDINTNFTGTIDGKGYTIKNLSINSNENYVGFVGCLGEKGLIKNINFENIDVTSGGWYIGTVCGKSQGEIQNVRVFGNINSSSRMAVGGLVGNSGYYSSIVNCISNVDIVSTSNEKPLIGGIAGSVSDALVKNNYYSGKITANSTNRVGGVFGQNIISIPNDPKIDSIDNIWNITESNIDKGVSELNPIFNQTDKGTIGIQISNDIRLKKGEISDELIKYTSTPSQVIGNLTSLDTSIVQVENNRAKAMSKGNTTISYGLYLGTNKVTESINVEVISDEPPVISGVTDSTIKAGEVANFDKLANITVTDDHDTNININVTGEIKIPKAGTDETYTLTYTATDSDGKYYYYY